MPIVKKRFVMSVIFLFALVLAVSGCARRAVVVTSTHWLGMASMERLTVLGSPKPSKERDALCKTYLNKIFASASLNQGQQEQIRSYICGDKDSVSELFNLYYSLPDDQRLGLNRAFAHYGYDVQGFGCFNSYG